MESNDHKHLIDQAVLALKGVVDGREKALANLLRSDAPLSVKIRGMLADALEGKSGFIALSTKGASKMKRSKAVRKWKAAIERGRRAEAYMASNGYDSARDFGKFEGRGHKSVEANVTFMRKARRWAQDRAAVLGTIADPEHSRLAQPEIMDMLFAMALAKVGRSALEGELFDEANKLFAQVVDEIEQAHRKWHSRPVVTG